MPNKSVKLRKTTRKATVCRFISGCTGKIVTVKNHSYAWSGRTPCTGMWRCVRCGKPEDSTTFNGKPKSRRIDA